MRHFEANAYGPADSQCAAHMRNCELNPRNSCRFCGLQFKAPLDSPVGHRAIDKRRRHEAICIRRPRRHEMHYPDYEMPAAATGRRHAASHCSRRTDYSRLAPGDPRKEAMQHIKSINASIVGLSRNDLRRILRQLQLQWHPDKNTNSKIEEKVAILVFHHVQALWDQAFKSKG
eukprot:Gregarina_sp_Poly_1__908@NODE_1219_length_4743_cov_25_233533_g750_i1_p3_GENE_NODE_1219_length_4743_cov_25_233533_g750_i1NODE_1219_length_4743_cov_25_233533_g750_i1_p3_ORF_typecomplete_len174_score19_97DnaJ/PF00226_31/0_00031_NODE_1219_length_4743_cov_25_233533_g750_i1430951